MGTADALALGREAFERYAWAEAYAHLSAAEGEGRMDPGDLQRLAVAAYLTGRDAESDELWERAHHALLRAGDVPAAVRCAFWLALGLLQRGEMARGGGWLARAQRQLDACGECVEQGYLKFPQGFQRVMAGDPAGAYAQFGEAAAIGERFGDADLASLGRHGQGRALLRMGETDLGTTLLDEGMVAITADETSPIVAGTVYCSVIEACQEIFDVRRAQEWTAALSKWCEKQPDLVPYRGQCLVHRSQLCQLHGDWDQALEEVRRACARLSDPPGQQALGMAWYQQAELHRVRGEFDAAEEAYRKASEHGHVPQPGLALLRLAQGESDAAVAAIRHAVADAGEDQLARSRLLAACVEIMLAVGDVAAARAAVEELDGIAADLDAPLLEAIAAHASGAVLLAEGDAQAALSALRRAWTRWWELQAPYETARVRVLIGLACQQLDDAGSAEMEWDSARDAFQEVRAAPDLARVDELRMSAASEVPGGLSGREVEVLALVAAGKSNREIAAELVISEHTVRRHVQNIFTKLDLTSRAAATAYAYEHDLV
jgi:DNA-binding CsgD family transcriptional regulator/tetratricopeptide (TPR) repeat protein